MIGLKHILRFSGLSLVAAPTIVSANAMVENIEEKSTEYNNLFNAIKYGSKPIDSIQKWTVDGIDFYNEDELDKYLNDKGEITEVQTSSNPSNIIKDLANGILDESKIYDLNQNNFQRVYRDAFGNVSLTKEAALNTYVNMGNVSHKYSYDNITWFDSPEEAKNAYVYRGGLSKSLYYFVNGRYYNVFNNKDGNALRNTLKEGYRISPSAMTKNQVLYGSRTTLENTVKETLKPSWTAASNSGNNELHYSNFLSKNVEKTFGITTAHGIQLKVHYIDNTEGHFESETTNIRFDNLDIDLNFLKNKDQKWLKNTDRYGIDVYRYYYYFKYGGMDLTNGKRFNKIELFPTEQNKGSGVNDVYFNMQTFEQKYQSTVKLFEDKAKTKQITQLTFNKNVSDWKDLSTQDVMYLYDQWFYQFKNKSLFNNIPDQISGNGSDIDRPKNQFGVAKDFLYDVNGQQGEKYSYYESLHKYHNSTKLDILNGPTKNENNQTLYQIRQDFWGTREQVENYIWLYGDMDIRLMYTFIDEQDISSIDGLLLAQTEAEARRKMFEYESKILYNRYFAYDVFGNSESSADSAEDAIQRIQNATAITSKYINKREIESWNGQPRSYNDIVQDGVYTVYSVNIPSSQQGKVYFYNYYTALNSVKKGVSSSILSSDEFTTLFLYLYVNEFGESKVYIHKNDNEIDGIIRDILN